MTYEEYKKELWEKHKSKILTEGITSREDLAFMLFDEKVEVPSLNLSTGEIKIETWIKVDKETLGDRALRFHSDIYQCPHGHYYVFGRAGWFMIDNHLDINK